MSKLTNVLEPSLVISITPEASQARRNIIRAVPNPIKRRGILALHDFTTRFPQAAASFFGTELLQPNLTYVGQGYDAVVFKEDNTHVIKVALQSICLSSRQLEALAKQKQEEYEVLADYLGPLVIAQETIVGPHPRLANRSAILTRQEYRECTDTGIFTTGSPYTNPAAIRRISETFSEVVPQVGDFLDASRRLYAAEKLLPDTDGASNIVVAHQPQPHLLLIDGFPINTSAPEVQNVILRQMRSLESALDTVA